ncbi:hypothetical protein ILUMI_11820 [Ignelater luminosus]|uniref:Spaetzle domain-containing protein n=1 Tax=Ignelater luminosus TaxID=2038154 RepID=A0A8K0GA46_IGNLU|nr:hypothetical protein ILUMI_11820 [Ignelater luminosus]
MLKKVPHYENLFGFFDGSLIEQGSKISGDSELEPLCSAIVHVKHPKTLLSQQNITKYIVNFDNYKQGISFTTCVKNARCGDASFPAGYVAECVQKYTTVRLVAVEVEKSKEPALDSFVIPSCCVCSTKRVV